MTIFFDYDGVLSVNAIKRLAMSLMARGVKCVCLTTRNSENMGKVKSDCSPLDIKAISIGDMIDEGLIASKADYIRMITRFQEEEAFMLVDNDPNEIIAALKNRLLAMMVPSDLTEDLFGEDIGDQMMRVMI